MNRKVATKRKLTHELRAHLRNAIEYAMAGDDQQADECIKKAERFAKLVVLHKATRSTWLIAIIVGVISVAVVATLMYSKPSRSSITLTGTTAAIQFNVKNDWQIHRNDRVPLVSIGIRDASVEPQWVVGKGTVEAVHVRADTMLLGNLIVAEGGGVSVVAWPAQSRSIRFTGPTQGEIDVSGRTGIEAYRNEEWTVASHTFGISEVISFVTRNDAIPLEAHLGARHPIVLGPVSVTDVTFTTPVASSEGGHGVWVSAFGNGSITFSDVSRSFDVDEPIRLTNADGVLSMELGDSCKFRFSGRVHEASVGYDGLTRDLAPSRLVYYMRRKPDEFFIASVVLLWVWIWGIRSKLS